MRTTSCGGILRKVLELLAMLALLLPVTLAQKPAPGPTPGPTPRPPTSNPGTPSSPGTLNNPINPSTLDSRNAEDRILFLHGAVATSDGSAVPYDVLVERVCNERVVQQVYAGPGGDFSMQLGSKTEAVIDASAAVDLQDSLNRNDVGQGIPRRQLQMCDLRTSAAGFRPSLLRLMEVTPTSGTVEVGTLRVERMEKVEGNTLNAAAYRAPKEAIKAYEKGLSAERGGKSEDAKKYFLKAVEIYPKYSSAWYELGKVRRTENDRDGAKAAFTQATETDKKFVPPYLALTTMAYAAQDWPEVLRLTDKVIEMDPTGHTEVTGYVLDMDPVNAGQAYFYNAMKAEHVDLTTHFPELHLLLAEIFSEKGNYAGAIGEIETYMELVPGAKDQALLQQKLAKLEELNGSAGAQKR